MTHAAYVLNAPSTGRRTRVDSQQIYMQGYYVYDPMYLLACPDTVIERDEGRERKAERGSTERDREDSGQERERCMGSSVCACTHEDGLDILTLYVSERAVYVLRWECYTVALCLVFV